MSTRAKKAKGQQIRAWHLNRRSGTDLSGLAGDINPQVRGWINYYGAFYRSELFSLCGASTSTSSDGPCRSSSDCEVNPPGHGHGSTASNNASPRSLLTGSSSASPDSRPVGAV